MARAWDAIVVGGGLAGIACAMNLTDAGARVLVLETRRKLGGRATSFKDVRTGRLIDNCQHVVMGCCTNYLDLCARLDVLRHFEWHESTHWYEPGGRVSRISSTRLPEPGHLAPGFLGATFLTIDEKIAVARAMTKIAFTDRSEQRERTFGEWLDGCDQPRGAVEKFWEPVVVSACNLPCARVSASVALHVIQEGFLANRRSPTIGLSRVPLVELYDPAESFLAGRGGEIRMGAGVARAAESFVETASGDRIEADRVVCAVPFERAIKIVDPKIQGRDDRFDSTRALTHSPILGVHLEFDRPVMETPHAVLVGSRTHWLFRKDDEGRRVHAVISSAESWVSLDEKEIATRVRSDMEAYLPLARGATLLSARPVKEKMATYAATPEGEAARPATIGQSELVLAGDYVRTGWPATMEGAVRSGYLAAEAVLSGETAGDSLVADIRPRGFMRFAHPVPRRWP